MGVALLDLVETALHVAKQALGKRVGKPVSGGLARETHIVAHCIRKEEGHSYAELVDRLSLMPDVCERLGISSDAPPDPTTFYHSFDRYAMYVWRALLRVSAQQHPQSGHVALDSTFFERSNASQYYCQRKGRRVKTVKATTLTDTESLAVLDVHCCIKHEHDTKAGPRVVRRNADDLRAVAADNGFQDWRFFIFVSTSSVTLSCYIVSLARFVYVSKSVCSRTLTHQLQQIRSSEVTSLRESM